jgi:hypothetical protein
VSPCSFSNSSISILCPHRRCSFWSRGRLRHERLQSLSAPPTDALQLRALALDLTKALLPRPRVPASPNAKARPCPTSPTISERQLRLPL